jgi:energy-coupling factor transport system permease protein
MSLLAEPIVADPQAPLARLNPVTKLAAALLVMLGLVLAGDIVTPAVVLVGELVAIAAAGVRWRILLRRLWLLLPVTAGMGLSTLLFTDQHSGSTLVDSGPVSISSGSLAVCAALMLRVVAIVLPGVVAFASTDPTDFADSLVQHLRAPPRFTFGALAAFRLLPLLGDEWHTLMLARRARGIGGGRSPIRRARLFVSGVFALLVIAIRRGVRLAVAMESRGFTYRSVRTVARPRSLQVADAIFVVATCALLAGATALSLALGTWRLLSW